MNGAADSPIERVATVALVPHTQRAAAVEVAAAVTDAFESEGCRVVLPEAIALAARLGERAVTLAEARASADLVVAIGGDGTLLGAFAEFPSHPLVGVHCGHLGYLAEVEPAQVPELAAAAASGELATRDRLTVRMRLDADGPWLALNDVVVDKRAAGRVVKLAVTVDGEPLTTFHADAVIVTTPTGSTAYNFSAGGPIVDAGVEAFCITPVAPHGLWNRSVVLGRDSVVRLELRDDRPATVLCDGRPVGDLIEGAGVEVAVSDQPARLVHWASSGLATRLRAAFGG